MVIDIVLERLNVKGSSSCDVESRMSNVKSGPDCTGGSSFLNPARALREFKMIGGELVYS